ncbi:hypothetical protein ACTNE5_06570 [Acidaminococcus fermentans]|uniref:hypothetical protein n=1 Tax=Acidaminococcus fermentans TaxID=905 RepID=UPI003F8CD0B7
MLEKKGNMKENDTKTLEEGILKDITRVIVETDEENPVSIAVITADNIESANGTGFGCGLNITISARYPS